MNHPHNSTMNPPHNSTINHPHNSTINHPHHQNRFNRNYWNNDDILDYRRWNENHRNGRRSKKARKMNSHANDDRYWNSRNYASSSDQYRTRDNDDDQVRGNLKSHKNPTFLETHNIEKAPQHMIFEKTRDNNDTQEMGNLTSHKKPAFLETHTCNIEKASQHKIFEGTIENDDNQDKKPEFLETPEIQKASQQLILEGTIENDDNQDKEPALLETPKIIKASQPLILEGMIENDDNQDKKLALLETPKIKKASLKMNMEAKSKEEIDDQDIVIIESPMKTLREHPENEEVLTYLLKKRKKFEDEEFSILESPKKKVLLEPPESALQHQHFDGFPSKKVGGKKVGGKKDERAKFNFPLFPMKRIDDFNRFEGILQKSKRKRRIFGQHYVDIAAGSTVSTSINKILCWTIQGNSLKDSLKKDNNFLKREFFKVIKDALKTRFNSKEHTINSCISKYLRITDDNNKG